MFLSSIVTYAMRVQIKWRVVIGALSMLIILMITYKVLFESESCDDDDFHQSKDAKDLIEYCNPPQQPANGAEGDVPSRAERRADGYSLLSVHIVIRHGDRTAIHSIPNTQKQSIDCHIRDNLKQAVDGMDDYHRTMIDLSKRGRSAQNHYQNYSIFPDNDVCDRAMLTPIGVAQHVRNGRFLRQKYSIHDLLGTEGPSLTERVLVRATKYIRTFQSAVAFLYGFVPELDISKINFEMANNNTMCTRQTKYQCSCPAIENFLNVFACTFHQGAEKIRRNGQQEAIYVHINAIYQRLANRLQVPLSDLPKLSHMFDVGVTHFCHNKHLFMAHGGCLESWHIRDLYDAINAIGQLSVIDDDYKRIAKLKMQPLMYEIAHRMHEQVSNQTAIKFALYSGHDSTVDPLACALGIASGVWPKYASRLVFELYAKDGRYFIRVVLDGSVVTEDLVFCQGRLSDVKLGLCQLEYFLKFVDKDSLASIHERDYNSACRKIINI